MLITCPGCESKFNFSYDEDEVDEEYGVRVECPECGIEFDPETA